MSHPVVVVMAGTGLPKSWAERFMRPLAEACQTHLVATLPEGGVGPLDRTISKGMASLAEFQQPGRDLVVVAHSQSALVAAMYAVDRPDVSVIALGAPFNGLQGLWQQASRFVPAVHDMRVGCEATSRLRSQMPGLIKRLHSIYSLHDGIVGWQSSHVTAAANHCLVASRKEFERRIGLDEKVYFVDRIGHNQLYAHPHATAVVADILADIPASMVAA